MRAAPSSRTPARLAPLETPWHLSSAQRVRQTPGLRPTASGWRCHAAPGEFTLASLEVSPSLIVDTRSYPEGAWGERAWVRGEFVTIMLLQGDFTAEQLTQEPPS